MSSDLWAAFGSAEAENPWSTPQPNHSDQAPSTSTTNPKNISPVPQSQEIDPWAAFETPSSKTAAAPVSAPPVEDEWASFESAAPTSNVAGSGLDDDWSAFESSVPNVVPSSALPEPAAEDTFNDNGLMWDADSALESQAPSHDHGVGQASASYFPESSTLIDISGLDVSGGQDDDDDFGDFQDAGTPVRLPSKPVTPAKVPAQIDVSSTIMQTRVETQGANAADRRVFGATKKGSTSRQVASANVQRGPPTTIKAKPKPAPAPVAITASVDDDYDDEAWDDFTSLPPDPVSNGSANSTSTSARGSSTKPQSGSLISTSTSTSTYKPKSTSLPPTNVPPPSILLTLLHSTILPSLTTPSSTTSTTSPNPTLRTAAHILAGRKSRWKRDTHLAQSMSISASGPGLKSGMKLTGVDKTETIREDREAAELARVFRERAGALRARAVKVGEKGIVDLGRGSLVVRVEKDAGSAGGGSGGVAATGGGKPCVVCGLRRAERVSGVDVEVYDGFGEWWVEHWGHRECKEWWEENESKLNQR